MAILEIPRDPSPRTLRWFGPLLGLVLSVVAGLLTLRHGFGTVPRVLLALAAGAAVLPTLIPALRRPLYLGWTYVFWPVGTVISIVLLGLVYFGVITPIGFLRRTLGRDPMQRGFDAEAATYWQPHGGRPDPERYFKTF